MITPLIHKISETALYYTELPTPMLINQYYTALGDPVNPTCKLPRDFMITTILINEFTTEEINEYNTWTKTLNNIVYTDSATLLFDINLPYR